VIDIGTGDGRFVTQSAEADRERFYIGIDANARALEKISERICRKPARGGLSNALFLHAAVEALPLELDGLAEEIHVNFPWGSLLRGVAAGELAVLDNLRRICAPGATLSVIAAFDPHRDRSELERLGVQPLTPSLIDSLLAPSYHAAGFEIAGRRVLTRAEWSRLPTSWARRLAGSEDRSVVRIIARAPAQP
jgi:16S rRNA (adenine(1408)-N(1))-methyltransferase